jgi:magnesium transporter
VSRPPEDLEDLLRDDGWVWLDLSAPTSDEVIGVARLLGFSHHEVEEVLDATEYPKLSRAGTYLFLVAHSPGTDPDRLRTVELDVFLGDGYLVTAHRDEVLGLEWIIDRATSPTGGEFAGPDEALAAVLEAGVRRDLRLIDGLEDQIEDLEDLAVAGDSAVVGRVHALRRDAITLRRVLAPQRDAIRALAGETGYVGPRAARHLTTVYDDHFRVVESLDTARSLLAAVLESHRSTIAERMNEVMKVLTVFSAIILPLSLLAGIYGMNFSNMPELGWRWAYFGLLGLMAVTAIGLWGYFSRRGFVSGPRVPRVDRAIGRGLAELVGVTTAPVRGLARLLTDDSGGRNRPDPIGGSKSSSEE